MLRFLLALVLLSLPLSASAQSTMIGPKQVRYKYRSSTGSANLLSGAALNDATAGNRTISLPVDGYDKVSIFVQLTRVAATDVTVTCTASGDSGTNYGSIQSSSIASGTATDSDFVDVKAVSGNKNFILDYAVNTYTNLRCVFSGTSAGASDLVAVQAIAGVGR